MDPDVGSKKRSMRAMHEVLPAPEGPTMATVCPLLILRLTLLNAGFEEFGYASVTFRNSSLGHSGAGVPSRLPSTSFLDDEHVDSLVDDDTVALLLLGDIMLGCALSKVKMLLAAVFARAISGLRLKNCPACCAENSKAGNTMKNSVVEYVPFRTCFDPLSAASALIWSSFAAYTHHQYARA